MSVLFPAKDFSQHDPTATRKTHALRPCQVKSNQSTNSGSWRSHCHWTARMMKCSPPTLFLLHMSSLLCSCLSFSPSSWSAPRRVPSRRMIGDVLLRQSAARRMSLSSSSSLQQQRAAIYCSAVNTSDMETPPPKNRWNDSLLQFSNWASLLCILDCTILPVLTVLLPLLGMVSSAGILSSAGLHAASHQLTRYVVLPLGTLATSINYFTAHKKKWITALGWCGLGLIALANSGGGCAVGHAHVHAAAPSLAARWLHTVQHGLYHRLVNLTGCALLMGSNYLSYRRSKSHAACCGGSHGAHA